MSLGEEGWQRADPRPCARGAAGREAQGRVASGPQGTEHRQRALPLVGWELREGGNSLLGPPLSPRTRVSRDGSFV